MGEGRRNKDQKEEGETKTRRNDKKGWERKKKQRQEGGGRRNKGKGWWRKEKQR